MARSLAALGPALFAAATLACTSEVREPCGGLCGAGTESVVDRCQPIVEAAPEKPEKPGKKRKQKRKRRVAKAGSAPPTDAADPSADPGADEPSDAPPPFVPVDDSKIPQFSNAEPQTLDLKAGSERLSESELDRHFAQVTPQIQRCVTTASAYGDIPAGSLKFKLRILPSGKVESVTLTTNGGLKVWG
ncbi:MAG: hypothetical protein JNK56_10025, partial [Myxococcales bacterium]|nr:hypothetical protein [Myxococcales bacterium]